MKIAYFISTINSKSKGQGGHYHSLAVTEKMIRRRCDSFIVNIGTDSSAAIAAGDARSYLVKLNNRGLLRELKRLRDIVDHERPDAIHAFDNESYLWARIMARIYRIPCVVTKCGGENPKVYWPYARDLVVYSGENLEYFKGKRKFRKTDCHLIPNRVVRVTADADRVESIRKVISARHDYQFVLLRIARIGRYYKQSILQLVQLMSQLRADGVDCCAVLVGAVEDPDLHQELQLAGGEHFYSFCDSQHTRNASELIDVADLVVGTGRSFMEGASFGKIMLAPVQGATFPVLVDEESFPYALHYNFSERLRIEQHDEATNYERIRTLFSDSLKLEQQREYSRFMFSAYFDGEQLIEKHMAIYTARKEKGTPHFIDLMWHSLFVLRKYWI